MPATEMTLMDEPDRLRLALTPIRRRLLGRLREPASAAGLAADLGLPRQRVGYHLRVLEEAGLIELVEERPRRGFVERVMRVTAKAFLVDPGVLAPPEEDAGAAGTAEPGARGDTTGTTDAGGAGSAGSAGSAGGAGSAGRAGGADDAARIEAETAAETDEEFRRVADRYAAEHLVEAAADTVRDVTRMADAADRQGVRLLTFTLEARVRFAEPGDVHDFADALAEALARVAERFDTPGGRPYRLVAGGHPAPAPAPARGKRAADLLPGAAAPATPNTEDPNDR